MENYVKKEVNYEKTVRYFNSKNELHRLDGPAVEWVCGDKIWLHDGKFHRLDGPAIHLKDFKSWRLGNNFYTKPNHNRLVLFFILNSEMINLF